MHSLNVYQLMNLTIAGNDSRAKHLMATLGDLPEAVETWFDTRQFADVNIPELQIQFVSNLGETNDMRELELNLWISSSSLLDRKYRVLLETERKDITLTTDRECLEWLVWGMQLQFLRSNATLVHAACVAHEGKAIMFPSWGGVGKTAIVAKFIRDMNWQLVGDDLVILTAEGNCLSFPKPMVLYPYHKAVFPDVFDAGQGPTAPAPLSHMLGRIAQAVKPALRLIPGALQYARNHNPQSARVPPSDIFGYQCISDAASLHTVVWLDRIKNIDKPMLVEADTVLASRLAGSTLHELDSWCENAINVACGLGILSFHHIYVQWLSILESALKRARTYILYIPHNTSIDAIADSVTSSLAEDGLL